MEQIAPLIQTVLWVGLIAGILWRFHLPIYGLLVALQKRIEAGSNIKAGPFELTEQLKPQAPSKQKEKAETEIREVLQAIPEPELTPTISSSLPSAATIQAKYFQAEDLVLRALQAEYGATVSRQVTAGADMGFDGAFVTNGRLNIVEVKYVAGSANIVSKLRLSVQRLSTAISGYGWHNVQIILVVVFENADDVAKTSEKLQELVSDGSVSLVVRCYSLTELQLKFGVVN
jgi:hypothetical protein